MHPPRGLHGLCLALQAGRAVPALPVPRHRREPPARHAGHRQQRPGHVHAHLPGLLPGPPAAHPLRGVPRPGAGDERVARGQGLADCAAASRLRRGVRDHRLQHPREQAQPHHAGQRQGLQRRRGAGAAHDHRQRGRRRCDRTDGGRRSAGTRKGAPSASLTRFHPSPGPPRVRGGTSCGWHRRCRTTKAPAPPGSSHPPAGYGHRA